VSPAPSGIVARVLTAWVDLRGSMRAVIEAGPSEGTLLVFAMASGLLRFLGRLADLWLGPEAARAGREELVSRIGAEFAGAMVFRVIALYALALLVWGGVRAAGGTGGPRQTRIALFWSALVAAPVMLAATLAGLAAGAARLALAPVLELAAGLAFAVALAAGLAEAHGFRSTWRVLAAIVAAVGLLALALRVATG